MDTNDLTIRIVYGLGNPGSRYERTRHNMGFMVIDSLALRLGAPTRKSRAGILFGNAVFAGRSILLAKPLTYMNLSGEPLEAMRVSPDDILVVHDDLDIPPGGVRVKAGGGTGGHKGLESVRKALGTLDFLRIRVGIGRPPEGMDPSDYVLGEIPREERDIFSSAIERAADAAMMCLSGEITRAMNTFNRKDSDLQRSRP